MLVNGKSWNGAEDAVGHNDSNSHAPLTPDGHFGVDWRQRPYRAVMQSSALEKCQLLARGFPLDR